MFVTIADLHKRANGRVWLALGDCLRLISESQLIKKFLMIHNL